MGEYSNNKCINAPAIINMPVPLYTNLVRPMTKSCNIKPIKSASRRTLDTGRLLIYINVIFFSLVIL